jgi:uncharacterized caspase-like protein
MATGESVGARRALLVAAETYADPGLARLRAPIGDVEALASVLEDPTLGAFELRRLVNLPTEEIKREIEGFFDDARLNDLLLLYMSGHGVLSQTRRFYFATSSTQLRWLRATAIEDSFISDVMQHSRARSIVLIVDCCMPGHIQQQQIVQPSVIDEALDPALDLLRRDVDEPAQLETAQVGSSSTEASASTIGARRRAKPESTYVAAATSSARRAATFSRVAMAPQPR